MHLHHLLIGLLADLRLRKSAETLDIVETGSIRGEGDEYQANDGWSTLLFAEQIRNDGGRFVSVDLDTAAAGRVLTAHGVREHVELIEGHSIDVLARMLHGGQRLDVAFLDSDNDAALILHEYLIAHLMVRSPGLILVDDVDLESTGVVKGHALIPWLDRQGQPYQMLTRTGDGYSTGVLVIEV